MPMAHLQDVSLHYELSGPAAAPVLVLSNSLGADFGLWDAQTSTLSQHFRVLRYDTRGHGGSSAPPGPYTLGTLGRDVLRLLDLLQIGTASVCGISLGGLTALWLAIHAPERIRSIVAANTAARIGTHDGWQQRIGQVLEQGIGSLVAATLPRWFTAAFLRSHAERIATVVGMFAGTSAEGYAACCAAIGDADLTAQIASIRLPVLVIAGLHDPVTPPSDAHLLEATIPGARLVALNAAHLSNVEAAVDFNREVLAFLRPPAAG